MTTTPTPVQLPEDELNHARIEHPEWWYFHGHLREEGSGNPIASFEYTAIQIAGRFYAYGGLADRVRRLYYSDDRITGSYIPDASDFTFKLTMDSGPDDPGNPWTIESTAGEESQFDYALQIYSARNNLTRWNLWLNTQAVKPPVLVGDDGVIVDEDKFSWLYSRTRLDATGYLSIGPEAWQTVQGTVWMDHQWGTPRPFTRRWRWFGIQMDSADSACEEYLFMLVTDKQGQEKIRLGYWIDSYSKRYNLHFDIQSTGEWQEWPIDNDISFQHPFYGYTVLNVRADIQDQLRIPRSRLNDSIQEILDDLGLLHLLELWEGACTVYLNGEMDQARGRAYTELGGF